MPHHTHALKKRLLEVIDLERVRARAKRDGQRIANPRYSRLPVGATSWPTRRSFSLYQLSAGAHPFRSVTRRAARTLCLGLLFAGLAFPAGAAAAPPMVKKIFLPPRGQLGNTGIEPLQPIDEAAWIWHPDFAPAAAPVPAHADEFFNGWRQPVLVRFRRPFSASAAPLRLHVSADERFELFLDGERIARGPDRSDVEHWAYATYELQLAPGQHRLEALVWSIGPYAPVAQMTWRGGFVLAAEGEYAGQLTTGKAAWEVARLDGDEFTPGVFFVGAQLTARDCGPQWQEGHYVLAQVIRPPLRGNRTGECAPGWKLFPTTLPDQIDQEITVGRAVALGGGGLAKDEPVPAEAGAGSGLAPMAGAVERSGCGRGAGPHRINFCSGIWAIITAPIR